MAIERGDKAVDTLVHDESAFSCNSRCAAIFDFFPGGTRLTRLSKNGVSAIQVPCLINPY